MKYFTLVCVTSLLTVMTSICVADDFTRENVAGDWTWTHMILDDEQEYPMNEKVELLPDGTYIQYNKAGEIRVRATWEISGDTLIYNDKRGEQTWKLVSFGDGKLHFDHQGAGMFFQRQ